MNYPIQFDYASPMQGIQTRIQSHLPPQQISENPQSSVYLNDGSNAEEGGEEPVIIRNSYIMVSSIDRNWYSSTTENPYNFTVKLGGAGDSVVVVPLFQNNPTVPATTDQAMNGSRGNPNIAGWISKIGTFYPAFDPSLPRGIIVDNETIVQRGDKFLVVNNEPRNIVSIGASKLLITNRPIEIGYSTSNSNVSCMPYLLINVSNIDYTTFGTNKLIDNSLGIMTPYIPTPTSLNNLGFTEYKNLLTNAKEFYNNPIASLSKLEISLTTASGGTIDYVNDVLAIYSIFYTQSDPMDTATEFLVIQTSTYFSPFQYLVGDTIIFQNYIYRDTGVYSEADTFNDYINSPFGFQIVGIDSSDPSTFLKNRIIICAPSTISTSSGMITNLSWYSSLKIKSMGEIAVQDVSGKLINSNLQTNIAFNIKYLEKTASFMNVLI
jgi:hypothetical protein